MLVLNEDWTADVVGRMHKYRILNPELAAEAGYTPAYVSTVLNGNKDLSDEAREKTKHRILSALSRIIERRMAEVESNEESADTDSSD